MKLGVDTNILAYAEGVNGPEKQTRAIALLDHLPQSAVTIPAQALGELFNVLVRKAKWNVDDARAAIVHWSDTFAVAETTKTTILAAGDLASAPHMSIWDSVILAVSAEANCRLLLSEDMQNGFTWQGVTVVNPFAAELHPLLAALTGNEP